jgi:hypothetical protein
VLVEDILRGLQVQAVLDELVEALVLDWLT